MQRPVKWAARLALVILLTGLVGEALPAGPSLSGAGEPVPEAALSGNPHLHAPGAEEAGALDVLPESDSGQGAASVPDTAPDADPGVEAASDPIATPKPVLPVPEGNGVADEPGGQMELNLSAVGIPAFRAAAGWTAPASRSRLSTRASTPAIPTCRRRPTAGGRSSTGRTSPPRAAW